MMNTQNNKDGGIERIESSNTLLNRPAPTASIYQKSLDLLDKLACVDGFEIYFENLLVNTTQNEKSRAELYRDPMQLVWEILQKGVSLCVLYNYLCPDDPISAEKQANGGLNVIKKLVYTFLKACKDKNLVEPDDLFTITDLFKDDTNSFVKVLKTVEIIVYHIESKGLLGTSKVIPLPSAYFMDTQLKDPTDNKERIVREFLDTERKYVQDLETLQAYMQELKSKNIVSNDTLRFIFANLNNMVDFQRRFIIGVEANSLSPPIDQRFGALFSSMEEGFSVYEPYCANYDRASKLTISQASALSKLSHIIEPHYELPSMLIKPIQRICKYPLILREMLKLSENDSPAKSDLELGYLVATRITDKVNEARRREGNLDIVRNLIDRIQDWKGYSASSFGELYLNDTFVMSTEDTTRELQVYLFDKILICCREVNDPPTRKSKQNSNSSSNSTLPAGTGNKELKLIGRIFLHSIHKVLNTSKLNVPVLTIFWRDVFMESFKLRCKSDEQLNLWKTNMEKLIAVAVEKHLKQNTSEPSPPQDQKDPLYNKSSLRRLDSYESDEELKNSNSANGLLNRLSEGVYLNLPKSSSYNDFSNRKTFDTYESKNKSSKADFYSKLNSPTPPLPSSVSNIDFSKFNVNSGGMSPLPSNSPSPVSPSSNNKNSENSATRNFNNQIPPISETDETPKKLAPSSNKPFKIKVHFGNDIYVLAVKPDISYQDLLAKVERKIKLCAAPNLAMTSVSNLNSSSELGVRIRYKDEDGDLILVSSDEDVLLAFESALITNSSLNPQPPGNPMSTLNLYTTLS
ncbi:Rho guanine nucleotide exchange factor scd1 [Smittium culicis]|uniref:Rho guanine nucleotide exchange factor scd1 n=1 Tax=Smittium culicis TaxID=133412 RepID=A0A1R1YLR7_9FUNG|nr:Rho guanine nucleotide exchange factor scd1 [Smittium culicis]